MSSSDEFIDKIKALAEYSRIAVEKRDNEMQTCLSVILPFLNALDYDHVKRQVKAESIADIGKKKGKRVDYALRKGTDDRIIMLVEAKSVIEENLENHRDQLDKYFRNNRGVKIAILTNGIEAWFYSDINDPNLMDDMPFFKFNFQENTIRQIEILENFCRENFSTDKAIKLARVIIDSQEFPSFSGILDINKENINVNSPYSTQREDNITSQTVKSEITQKNESSDEYFSVMDENKQKIIKQSPTKEIYEKYFMAIKKLDNNVEDKPEKHYITFSKDEKIIVTIIPKAKHITLSLNIKKITDIDDYRNICKDKTGSGHLGVGNVVVEAKEMKDFDYIMGLVQQVYNLKSQESITGRQANEQVVYSNSIQENYQEENFNLMDPKRQRYLSNPLIRELYNCYSHRIRMLGCKEPEVMVQYIKFNNKSNGETVASIVPRAKYIQIVLNIDDVTKLTDDNKFCKNKKDRNHLGKGNGMIEAKRIEDLESIMDLVKQVFDNPSW